MERPGSTAVRLARAFSNDQQLDASANVVANGSDAFERLALRVVQWPVIAAHAGHVRTLVAASHRDQELRLGGEFSGELLRARTTQVNALFLHHRNNLGMDAVPRRCPRGQRSRFGWISQLVEKRSSHAKQTTFTTEAKYNDAIIAACHENDIEVIGVTDHYRIEDSWGLIRSARDAGIFAFAGFEAVSKDGVHFLCLFDADRETKLERFIGECGIRDSSVPSPIGSMDATELMEHAATKWEASCIAAHAISDGGILRKLSGQTRIQAWCSEHLLACAIAGPVASAPHPVKPILENKDLAHKRERPVAVLNVSDVNAPEDLATESATTFIKMSAPSIEALRQAFLDPESRIRLNTDPEPEPHAEFLALWQRDAGRAKRRCKHTTACQPGSLSD